MKLETARPEPQVPHGKTALLMAPAGAMPSQLRPIQEQRHIE